MGDEEGIDEIIHGYPRLPDHPSQSLILPQASWAINREIHRKFLSRRRIANLGIQNGKSEIPDPYAGQAGAKREFG
jgi:hypothetical protein